MKLNTNARISIGIAAAFALVVGILLAVNAAGNDPDATPAAGPSADVDRHERLVRPDSHKLGVAPDGKATFVEFLDFECESCRAAFPAIEQLRKDYAGKVTFVVRYFPIPSHFNAERAARAVEAAAQQGKFEQMYQKMYETQTQWGEQQVPADELFRGFAKDLGLDLAAWDKAYDAPATLGARQARRRRRRSARRERHSDVLPQRPEDPARVVARLEGELDAALK